MSQSNNIIGSRIGTISLSSSNSSNTKLVSKNGKALLSELSDPQKCNLQLVQDYIAQDPLAGLLRDPKTGNNAFHLLMDNGYKKEIILPILSFLVQYSPNGLQRKNSEGYLPLHLYLRQWQLESEVVDVLLKYFPEAAGQENGQGMIPLFTCVMREASSVDICRSLCKSFPNGPSTMNKTHSFPLHFAAKRSKPNKEILKILLRRFPSAAMHANDFGLLPLHLVSSSDDVEATRLIYEANKEAIQVCDRQGRTCLHIAVLAVGKDHSNILAAEEEELQLVREQQQQQQKQLQNRNNSRQNFDDDQLDDDEANESDEEAKHVSSSGKMADIVERQQGKSRAVVRFLIEAWPTALVIANNFFSTPVETVLEKTKPVRSKKKIVTVFGLYDDPPTARLLLLSHQRYAQKGTLPAMKGSQVEVLRDLNWAVRRDALLVSYVGSSVPGRICTKVAKAPPTAGKKDLQKDKEKDKKNVLSATKLIERHNLLARLRDAGLVEIVRIIILLL